MSLFKKSWTERKIKKQFLKQRMKHSEILKKWIWKRYQENDKYKYQCISWVKKYCEEMWRPIGTFGGSAYDWWVTWKPFNKNWKKVVKTPLNYPLEWDLVFWGTTWGKWYWHVAIANKFCNPMVLRTTDQNAGTGNWDWLGKNAINPFFRSYKWVVGWYTWIG